MDNDSWLAEAKANDSENDYRCVNCDGCCYDDAHGRGHVHDRGHDRDLANVDSVVGIVLQLHDDRRSIDPNIDKIHDEGNTGTVMSLEREQVRMVRCVASQVDGCLDASHQLISSEETIEISRTVIINGNTQHVYTYIGKYFAIKK
jgi:hypothetical protein